MAREYPADERQWTQPARIRIGVVLRRLWPSVLVALVLWLGWAVLSRRRQRAPV